MNDQRSSPPARAGLRQSGPFQPAQKPKLTSPILETTQTSEEVRRESNVDQQHLQASCGRRSRDRGCGNCRCGGALDGCRRQRDLALLREPEFGHPGRHVVGYPVHGGHPVCGVQRLPEGMVGERQSGPRRIKQDDMPEPVWAVHLLDAHLIRTSWRDTAERSDLTAWFAEGRM